jgi:hypothetical protein
MLAVFAFSAVAATAAQADPWWIVKCHNVGAGKGRYKNATCTELGGTKEFDTRLLAGETRNTRSKQNSGTSGVFKLKTTIPLLTIECTSETDKGQLIGGWPGTDTSEITFDGCHVAGKTVAQCGASSTGKPAGEVGPFKVKTLLGFPKGRAPNKEEAYDQFFPEPSETEFISFELTGTACGTLNKDKIKVLATGTKAKVTGTPLCGVIARVGKIAAGAFKKTASGETATEGGLEFPTPAITEEEVWNPTTEKYEVVKCGLEVQTSSGPATAEEVGVAIVEVSETLVPFTAEPFGWEE